MPIKIPVSIDVVSANPIDTRLILSKDEMFDTIDVKMPDVYFTICRDDGNLYIYNKQNEIDPDTGKYRLVKSDVGEVVLDEKSISKNAKGELEIKGYSAEDASGKWLHKNDNGDLEWVDFKISKPIIRTSSAPLDSTYIWDTLENAMTYVLSSITAYVGQIIYIKEKDKHYKITKNGLSELSNDQIIQLYNELGDHTDGAITQKAISDMINEINEKIVQMNEKIVQISGKVDKKIEAVINGEVIWFN